MLIQLDSGGPRKRGLGIPKYLIGWSERVAFPDWGIEMVEAKVDTGAASSALHVEEMKVFKSGRVQFRVVLDPAAMSDGVMVKTPLVKWARVRSSNGEYSKRCFVTARVVIGPVMKDIELSLVSREKMSFRMLLGRKALEQDFVVDVSRRRVLS